MCSLCVFCVRFCVFAFVPQSSTSYHAVRLISVSINIHIVNVKLLYEGAPHIPPGPRVFEALRPCCLLSLAPAPPALALGACAFALAAYAPGRLRNTRWELRKWRLGGAQPLAPRGQQASREDCGGLLGARWATNGNWKLN